MNQLTLSSERIQECRQLANKIAADVQLFIDQHTTKTVERAILRLLGIDGVDSGDVPIVNRLVDHLDEQGRLGDGISLWIASRMKHKHKKLAEVVTDYIQHDISFIEGEAIAQSEAMAVLQPYVDRALDTVLQNKQVRQEQLAKSEKKSTELYVIVATGNIHEDVKQAQAAAESGADIIAVIRTTGQSLLDYVPYGLTTEGFGGTYATQANFKIMRKALDDIGHKLGRYIKLVNYASGLCMPEIAAMAALERLDVLLNDSMYGIIFRDINMKRTFVDQFFSRRINAFAGIIINTGEDNYLTTADAIEEAHTVLASQFINEQFAFLAKLKEELMGLGHAFEIDPAVKNGFLYEIAQAQMARQIFPKAPLKYMPPTKHINGHIFRAYQQNTLFNVATQMTNQSIHLLGILTEAIHTPFLSDRHLAIQNAKMIQTTMADLADEIEYKRGGIIEKRAQEVLEKAHDLLKNIAKDGLFSSLEKGVFANIKRSPDGGKGLQGVQAKSPRYFNVILDRMEAYDAN